MYKTCEKSVIKQERKQHQTLTKINEDIKMHQWQHFVLATKEFKDGPESGDEHENIM